LRKESIVTKRVPIGTVIGAIIGYTAGEEVGNVVYEWYYVRGAK